MLALLVGIATRDCILMASAALLAVYTARTAAVNREAVDLLRSAIHCSVVGGASIVIALALVAMVTAMHSGLWDGNGLDTSSMIATLSLSVVAVGLPVVADVNASRRRKAAAGHVTFGALAVMVAYVARAFDASGPCMFALGVAAITALLGWHLVRTIGAELVRTTLRN